MSCYKNVKDFKDLEEKTYGSFCKAACEFMKYILESMDKEVLDTTRLDN